MHVCMYVCTYVYTYVCMYMSRYICSHLTTKDLPQDNVQSKSVCPSVSLIATQRQHTRRPPHTQNQRHNRQIPPAFGAACNIFMSFLPLAAILPYCKQLQHRIFLFPCCFSRENSQPFAPVTNTRDVPVSHTQRQDFHAAHAHAFTDQITTSAHALGIHMPYIQRHSHAMFFSPASESSSQILQLPCVCVPQAPRLDGCRKHHRHRFCSKGKHTQARDFGPGKSTFPLKKARFLAHIPALFVRSGCPFVRISAHGNKEAPMYNQT